MTPPNVDILVFVKSSSDLRLQIHFLVSFPDLGGGDKKLPEESPNDVEYTTASR
jgi:hypothetical protein